MCTLLWGYISRVRCNISWIWQNPEKATTENDGHCHHRAICSSVEACILPAPRQTSIQQLFHVWHSFFLSIPRASVLNIAIDEVAWQRWDAAGVHHNCPLLTFLLGAHGGTAGSLLSLISDGTCCWCQTPPADLSSRFAKCWVEQCWSLDFWSQ